MLVICGKSCTGKDTVAKILMKKFGYHKIVTYTTRPIRSGEVDGVDYHFITDDNFSDLAINGFFAEMTSYNTVKGVWRYGTSIESLKNADDYSVIIMNPDGVKTVRKFVPDAFIVEIEASTKTRFGRSRAREDNIFEALRRIKADNHDFKHMNRLVDHVIHSTKNSDPELIAKEIDIGYKIRGNYERK